MDRRKDHSGKVLKDGESQRSDGRYSYRWTDAEGKRQCMYAQTLDLLREKEQALTLDLREGIRRDDGTILNQVFEMWKEDKRGLKATTFENYSYMYEHFIAETFGKRKVCEIRKSDVRRFYNSLVDGGKLKCNTLDSINTILHQVLKVAVEGGYLRNNPSSDVYAEVKRSHNFETPKRHALTIPEQETFMKYVRESKEYSHWYPLFAFFLGTGMPHNQEGINRAIKRILRDYNETEFEKADKQHRKPNLLPDFSCHNFRHTFATRYCENETNIKVIQEVLGNRDIATTMDVYAEATKEAKMKSFANMEGKIKIS